MAVPLELVIIDRDRDQLLSRVTIPDTVLVGRQLDDSEQLYQVQRNHRLPRLPIIPWSEESISRKQAILRRHGMRLSVTNKSSSVGILLPGGTVLPSGEVCELDLPATLKFKRLELRVQEEQDDVVPAGMCTLAPFASGVSSIARRSPAELSVSLASGGGRIEELLSWLQSTIDVLHSAASSSDFFAKAAQGIVEIAGLERGRVLLLQNDVWVEAARYSTREEQGGRWEPSQQVLALLRKQQRTFWQDPLGGSLEDSSSLRGAQLVVASPILSAQNEVIGALYGDSQKLLLSANAQEMHKVAAMMVELLARGVGLGLARLEQEQQALSARVQFEQFFTPDLARELQNNPALLDDGRTCPVSVLFCDIRGFSRISERLGPQKTIRWIRDVLSVLSNCVLKYNGVLVDYIGDELMAMWGAPQEQPDHADRACQAALDMLAALPELSARWHDLLEEQFTLGIGINTGEAHVGNIGSTSKFKYGPLGNTVNLGSRVQGVTKYLKCSLLITESTRQALKGTWHTRCVGEARVVNIKEPVTLYELSAADRPHWSLMCETYEKALADFKANNFRLAARALANLLGEVGSDGPALVLMSRAVNALVEGPTPIHPLWEVPK